MTRSRILASLMAAALMAYLIANGAIAFGYRAWTLPGMVCFGWACVFFGNALADFLELPESWSPAVLALHHRFIQGLGWLSMGIVAGLVLVKLVNS